MIFIWIPKTGGTTFVNSKPSMQVVTENYADFFYKRPYHDITYGHACPKQLLRHEIIGVDAWHETERVAIVRDPFARFVSLYYDYKRTGRIPQDFKQIDFIRAITEMDPKPGLFNSYGLSMCAPQVEWLIPGINILRFEDIMPEFSVRLNDGKHNDVIDEEARRLVWLFYRADFVTLNYSISE